MGSLTWLFPMPATLIHSGLPPFATIPKQNLFSATCKSDQIRQPSLSQTSRVIVPLACCIWMGVRRVVDMNWHDLELVLKELLHQPAWLLISAFFWNSSASRACSVPVYITVAVHMAKRRWFLSSAGAAVVMGNQMYASGESVLPPFANCLSWR